MATVLFYDKPVAISRDLHRNAKVGATTSFAFAADTNSVALTVAEFFEASKEYPIVFAAVGERRIPVALLGLRDRENLYVDKQGKWIGHYVPAFVRRYPFVLADNGNGEYIVCVDEASPAFDAADGQALFDETGKNTPVLDNAMNFLNAYQAEFIRTEAFVRRLQELDLLKQMSAKTELADGRSFVLDELYVVDEQKLVNLDEKSAAELLKTGQAAFAYAHLMSLSNMGRLVDRIDAVTAAASGEPKAASKPAAARPPAAASAKRASGKA
jgi:hypothetical protein